MNTRARVLISACLLGEPVRYDGGDKRSEACLALGRALELVSLCPEVELGMGVPREPIDLRAVEGRLRLLGRSGRDWSPAFREWAQARLEGLGPIHGALLKSKSPSCGLEVPHHGGEPPRGPGLWVQALLAADPDLPCLDERACADPAAREAFRRRVQARADLERCADPDLPAFHREHAQLLGACAAVDPGPLLQDPPRYRGAVRAGLGRPAEAAELEALRRDQG